MKKQLIRYLLLAVCFAVCGAAISKTIRTNIQNLRSDYFLNAKGKAQHFITSVIQ
jgi:hypothetical protein